MGLSISASACGQCHACACMFVCICMRIHMCVGTYICAFLCSGCCMHFTGVLGTSAWAGVYITQVHVCVYRCMYICMYMYICMSVYMYASTFIYAHVWVYICTRVGAFSLFVLSNLSTTCACITGVS